MIFYGILVEFINDIGGSIDKQILRCLFSEKPTQEQADKAVSQWVENVAIACESGKSLCKVSKIHKVKILDFVLVEQ